MGTRLTLFFLFYGLPMAATAYLLWLARISTDTAILIAYLGVAVVLLAMRIDRLERIIRER